MLFNELFFIILYWSVRFIIKRSELNRGSVFLSIWFEHIKELRFLNYFRKCRLNEQNLEIKIYI